MILSMSPEPTASDMNSGKDSKTIHSSTWAVMIHFCTYFDRNYIHRGLALHQSLVDAKAPFTLWILCFDTETLAALLALHLPNVRLISESDFERGDDALQAVKATRSRVEYYWTCTPSLPLYVLRQDPAIELVSYLDADTFFYYPPTAIIDELGVGSILIVPHDHSPEFESRIDNGIYNVGIMAFRRDAEGMRCLEWWRERCIEWCYYRQENGQLGDQAYLNDWPNRFENVVVSANPGINAGPWNIAKYGVAMDSSGRILVGGRLLVCYHFHSCRVCTSRIAHITGFNVAMPTSQLSVIYRPYLDALVRAERLLSRHRIDLKIPKSGFPWRYILGRIRRRQPLRHFMRMKTRVN